MLDPLLQLAFIWLAKLIIWLRPFVPVICFLVTWAVIAMLVTSIMTMVKEGLANVRRMHRIPCADCRYATNDYRLKCPVNPSVAFSDEAIGCQDFETDEGQSQTAFQ